jgi:hypothetical protein
VDLNHFPYFAQQGTAEDSGVPTFQQTQTVTHTSASITATEPVTTTDTLAWSSDPLLELMKKGEKGGKGEKGDKGDKGLVNKGDKLDKGKFGTKELSKEAPAKKGPKDLPKGPVPGSGSAKKGKKSLNKMAPLWSDEDTSSSTAKDKGTSSSSAGPGGIGKKGSPSSKKGKKDNSILHGIISLEFK